MREILRRVALLAGAYGALVAACHAREALVEVRPQDWAAEQARRPRWEHTAGQSLEAFIAERSAGWSADGTGDAWQRLARALVAAPGSPLPEHWAERRGHGYARDGLFLLPGEPPLDASAFRLSSERPFLYVRVPLGDGVRWLEATWRTGHGLDDAPGALVHPWRHAWPWLAGAALLVYVLLPRRPRAPDTLAYGSVRAAILPDVVGLMLGGLFVVFAVALPRAIAGAGPTFQPALWPVYLVCAIFVGLALTIHGWAAWYASFRLRLHAGGLTLATLGGTREVAFSNLASAHLAQRLMPLALRRLSWFAGLFSVRGLGQSLLIASRSDPEVVLTERDGRTTRLLLTALNDGDRALAHLTAHGFPVGQGHAGRRPGGRPAGPAGRT